jgi:hypothetical protein
MAGPAAVIRLRRLHLVCAALGLTVAVFTLLSRSDLGIPVGVLTSASAPAQPVAILEPPILAAAVAQSFFSDFPAVEVLAARRIWVWHFGLVGATILGTCGVLLLQGMAGGYSSGVLVALFGGYVGLAAFGSALWGRLGWVIVAALLTLVMVAGVDAENQPVWWAWPLASTALQAALAAGFIGLAAAVAWAVRLRGRGRSVLEE